MTKGVCFWFTGLSGSGKTETALALRSKLWEFGRTITLLDGDVVRTNLSKGLGFSKEDRDTNVLRIGFVAREVCKHGGTAICAAISPYAKTRLAVRNMFQQGQFIEIYMDTPLEVCEQRDPKGLYAKARRSEIENFTGVSDPYEAPRYPEIWLLTVDRTIEDNVEQILSYKQRRLFLADIYEDQ